MTSQLWWYTARAGGLVAWALLTAGVLWGLALSTRALGRTPRPNWLLDLHRFLGGTAVVFLGIHIVSLVLDSYVHFGWVDVLVPFAASWHPAAVAWGVIGFYLLLAVEITSLLRKRLSKRAWRLTHFLSFPLFALATAHLLTAGTDRTNVLVLSSVLAATAAVIGLTAVRVRPALRPAAPSTRPIPERRSPEATAAGLPHAVATGAPAPEREPVGV